MPFPFKFTAAMLICASFAGAASAQKPPASFIGPAFGISVSAVQNKAEYESAVTSINGQSSQANDSDASLQASYGFEINPQWVGTVGLSYSVKTSAAGTVDYTSGGAQAIEAKFKNHTALSFAPGLRVGNNTLVYGKLAYHQLSVDYTDSASTGGTTQHTGTGLGFGAAFAIDPSWEVRAEYEAVAFASDKVRLTTGKPIQSGLTFGVFYRF